MIIQLRDMRDLRTHCLSYYSDLTEAETQAVSIMDTIMISLEIVKRDEDG